MSFENLIKDPTFASGLVLLNNIDDKILVHLVDRILKNFELHRPLLFTEQELVTLEKSLNLNCIQCQSLLDCLTRLLKEVISDVTKPVVLRNLLSNLFSLNVNKVKTICEYWTANAAQVISRIQQNVIHSYKLKDVNWALNISSNVGLELSSPEPRCLIEFKVEDGQYNSEHKTKEIILDLNEEELKKLYDTLETIKIKLNTATE